MDERLNILGTGVSVLNLEAAVMRIENWLAGDEFGRYVCVTGVHGVVEGLSDPDIRRLHNDAALCVPDGMPLSWVGWLHGRRKMDRVYGPDLMLSLLERSISCGYSHFFYGGKEGVADLLRERMTARFAGLRVAGTWSPPFRDLTQEEEDALVRRINELEPDLMWLGISTPRQEALMARLQLKARVKVMIGVGAAFDIHAGLLRQAPRWMMRCGLEWSFRLCQEPRRLWKRYLIGNPRFLHHLFCQSAGLRRYPMDEG